MLSEKLTREAFDRAGHYREPQHVGIRTRSGRRPMSEQELTCR